MSSCQPVFPKDLALTNLVVSESVVGCNLASRRAIIAALEANQIDTEFLTVNGSPIVPVNLSDLKINTDSGTISPDAADAVDIQGLVGGSGIVTEATGASSMLISDLRNLTPFIVGTDPSNSEYTSIQTALDDAAVAGGMVIVKAGTYTENLTLPDGAVIQGLNSTVNGSLTYSGASTVVIENLTVSTPAPGSLLTINGGGTVTTRGCNFVSTLPISVISISAGSTFVCYDGFINSGLGGIAGVSLDGTGNCNLLSSTVVGSMASVNAINAGGGGLVQIQSSFLASAVNITNSFILQAYSSSLGLLAFSASVLGSMVKNCTVLGPSTLSGVATIICVGNTFGSVATSGTLTAHIQSCEFIGALTHQATPVAPTIFQSCIFQSTVDVTSTTALWLGCIFFNTAFSVLTGSSDFVGCTLFGTLTVTSSLGAGLGVRLGNTYVLSIFGSPSAITLVDSSLDAVSTTVQQQITLQGTSRATVIFGNLSVTPPQSNLANILASTNSTINLRSCWISNIGVTPWYNVEYEDLAPAGPIGGTIAQCSFFTSGATTHNVFIPLNCSNHTIDVRNCTFTNSGGGLGGAFSVENDNTIVPFTSVVHGDNQVITSGGGGTIGGGGSSTFIPNVF